MIEVDLTKPLPSAFAIGGFTRGAHPMTLPNYDEITLRPFIDGDPNSVDIFYVPNLNDGLSGIPATAYNFSRNGTDDPAFKNFIVIGPYRGPVTVGHELMHILLDQGHRVDASLNFLDPITALFHVTTTKAVDGTKRIGPYPEAAASVGNGDTFTIRANAEQLP